MATTTEQLRDRHQLLNEVIDAIKTSGDDMEPKHVIELCKLALNFSAMAQEVETNRLEQLKTMRQMCANRVVAPTKKLTLLLDYIEQQIKT